MGFTSLEPLLIAFALGMLVGLQRQRAEKPLAGIRTFPLITVFGTICALLDQHSGYLMIPLGLLAVVVLVATENLRQQGLPDYKVEPGITTEVAIVVMFGVGAYLPEGERAVALAVTGAVMLLLYAKQPLHRFVRQMGEGDIAAIAQFVLISLVILPLLPRQVYGPYQVLNPFEIWLMVVLIVGLNLFGYVAFKFFSARTGILVNGALGGLVSSTATTVSFARRAGSGSIPAPLAALVIVTASTVVFVRILLEIAVVAPDHWLQLSGPIITLLILNILVTVLGYFYSGAKSAKTPILANPAELKPALMFGVLYAVVIFAVAATKELFGDQALYVVAILSGLTDVDAITLSTAQLVNNNRITAQIGWRIIICGALANLGFKLFVVALLGGKILVKKVFLLFLITLVGGIVILGFWPDYLTELGKPLNS